MPIKVDRGARKGERGVEKTSDLLSLHGENRSSTSASNRRPCGRLSTGQSSTWIASHVVVMEAHVLLVPLQYIVETRRPGTKHGDEQNGEEGTQAVQVGQKEKVVAALGQLARYPGHGRRSTFVLTVLVRHRPRRDTRRVYVSVN